MYGHRLRLVHAHVLLYVDGYADRYRHRGLHGVRDVVRSVDGDLGYNLYRDRPLDISGYLYGVRVRLLLVHRDWHRDVIRDRNVLVDFNSHRYSSLDLYLVRAVHGDWDVHVDRVRALYGYLHDLLDVVRTLDGSLDRVRLRNGDVYYNLDGVRTCDRDRDVDLDGVRLSDGHFDGYFDRTGDIHGYLYGYGYGHLPGDLHGHLHGYLHVVRDRDVVGFLDRVRSGYGDLDWEGYRDVHEYLVGYG